ncbi:MAG: exodeoxyribonuclease III [Syntrophobacteraceae bacterium]
MVWKIATFNVNGIRSRRQVVESWLRVNRPDVLCLQEIKCRDAEFPYDFLREAGYEASVCGQKAFHGVAILSLRKPEAVRRGFADGGSDVEARLIAAKIDGIWIYNSYVPQGRSPDHPAFQEKLGYFARLKKLFAREHTPSEPILWVGDINVAPEDIDVFSPHRMEGKIGFHPLEKQALSEVTAWGFVDLFRKHHPEVRQFTFWDYRLPKSFEHNLGWRLDHIRATECVAKASIDCRVDATPRGESTPSDHTPVLAEFAGAGAGVPPGPGCALAK